MECVCLAVLIFFKVKNLNSFPKNCCSVNSFSKKSHQRRKVMKTNNQTKKKNSSPRVPPPPVSLAVSPSVRYFLFLQEPCRASPGLFLNLVFFLLCVSQTGGGGTFQHSLRLLPVSIVLLTSPELPPSGGLFLVIIRCTGQTTRGAGRCTSIYMIMCEQRAHKASAPVSVRLCPLSVLFHFL